MKTYTKTHTSKAALLSHQKKIEARGGATRIKGLTITYRFLESKGSTDIEARNTVDLIIEASKKGYRKVRVVFYPTYDKAKHGRITNKKLIASLKKGKSETFDVIDETKDILDLLKSEDVKSIKFVSK